MKKVEIKIGNEVFPCRQTMGAMLRFKQETGREVTEIDATSFTDICTSLIPQHYSLTLFISA
jgi:hypothetical protein